MGKDLESSGSWGEEMWKYSQDGTDSGHKEAEKEKGLWNTATKVKDKRPQEKDKGKSSGHTKSGF